VNIANLRISIVAASALAAAIVLEGCGVTPAPPMAVAEGQDAATVQRIADLQIVDCLLPSKVRRLGGARFMTPRRPTRTTQADCRIRGGEYTEYDRANLKTALTIWMPAAQAGGAEAMTNVGEIYERGLGGEANYEAAAIWYEKAANKGNSRAQFNLGTLYEQGLGVSKDRLVALNWYRQAWGIPEDDIIMQSAAKRELEAALAEKDMRIDRLDQSLQRLEAEKASMSDQDTVSDLNEEIDDLRLWIASLEEERATEQVKLSSIPKLRTPIAPADYSRTAGSAEVQTRGDIDFGKYFAVVIGNEDYSKIEVLETPANDARQIATLLEQKYGFVVQLLVNAGNIEIMETINDLNDQLGENDNLLIYYAGHGARVTAGDVESGFWLPVNADAPPRDTFWVSNEFVTNHLGRLSAKRILVMADSCYAGLLSDSPDYVMLDSGEGYSDDFLRYKLAKRSRLLLSSGGDKPVLDSGAPNHSVFAAAVLEVLESNEEIMSGPQLFAAIDSKVTERAMESGFAQQAEYKVIKSAGHEVGGFFFVPTE
jgi:uncharacterized caspase-like protein